MAARNLAPFPPEFVRRVLDDVANHGAKPKQVADLTDTSAITIGQWLQKGGIRLNVKVSQEEIDLALRKVSTFGIEKRKKEGIYDPDHATLCEYRELSELQQEYVEMGFSAMDSRPDPRTPEEMAAFAGVLSVVDRQLEMLDTMSHTAESIQEVTATLSAAISLKQLRNIFIDPPRVKDWKDAKIVVDMAREALDMNRKVKEVAVQQRAGVDVNILEFDPRKPRAKKTVTLDAEVMHKEL
jgi:hypothetical protein